MASIFFDASTVAPQASSTPIPADVYFAHITESSIVPTKAGNGQVCKLTFEILDGQYKGRKVFENLNIQNVNPETQRIAQSQLSAICHATGVIKLNDTSALHYKPLRIKVVVKEAEGQYAARNQIKGYEDSLGSLPQQAQPTAPAAGPVSNAPAWAKRA